MSKVYWVDAPEVGRIAVVGRPRAVATFAEYKAEGIDVLVSMLEPEEADEVGLRDEAAHCEAAGITFIQLPITDHGVPTSFEAMDAAIAELTGHLAEGRGVGAHCYASVGRSPLLIIAVLIAQGIRSDVACDLVSSARGYMVPEMDSQHRWLTEFELRRSK